MEKYLNPAYRSHLDNPASTSAGESNIVTWATRSSFDMKSMSYLWKMVATALTVIACCFCQNASAQLTLRRGPRLRPINIRLPPETLRTAPHEKQTHIFMLPRACRKLPCAMRAKAQLQENGCSHVVVLDGLQMLRAHCGRTARLDVLRASQRFASIEVDHSISLVAFKAQAAPGSDDFRNFTHSLSAFSVIPRPAKKTTLLEDSSLHPVPVTESKSLPASVSRELTEPARAEAPEPSQTTTDTFESIELRGSLTPAARERMEVLEAGRRARFVSAGGCYPRAGAGTRIFVIDTGCRVTHEQFDGRVESYASPGSPYRSGDDDHGHGTHVAATIAGRDFGVARAAQITCIKALSGSNTGSSADVISAIDHVIGLKRAAAATSSAPAPFLMSISLGVRAPPAYSALDRAVSRAAAAGIVPIVAAGNAAHDACTFTPARARGAITVAALAGAQLASFSNTGVCVALAAPGVAVRSAYHAADDAYARSSGTSMAAPYVTGAAALVLGERPGLGAREVLRELRAVAAPPTGGVPVAAVRQVCTVAAGSRAAWRWQRWLEARRAA